MKNQKDRYPLVSVALLNWNNVEDTLECLSSLKEVRYPNVEVLVVDNGSEDDSVVRLQDFVQSMPFAAHLLTNEENKGFSGGCNTAIEWALREGKEYLLLLNNDTAVDPLFLDRLVAEASMRPQAGILVPSIFFYYEPSLLWFGGMTNVRWGRMNRGITSSLFGKELPQEDSQARPISFATGCAMLLRVEALPGVGGFDERFFLYFEDADLSFRFRKNGWDIVWVPDSHIQHKVSATTLAKVGSPRMHYYDTRNVLLLSHKHGPWWMSLYRPLWALWTLAKQLVKIAAGRNRDVSGAIAWGVIDYYRGCFGKYNHL